MKKNSVLTQLSGLCSSVQNIGKVQITLKGAVNDKAEEVRKLLASEDWFSLYQEEPKRVGLLFETIKNTFPIHGYPLPADTLPIFISVLFLTGKIYFWKCGDSCWRDSLIFSPPPELVDQAVGNENSMPILSVSTENWESLIHETNYAESILSLIPQTELTH